MLATRNRARSASVCGSSSTAVGGAWAAASAAWSTSVPASTPLTRRATTLAPTMLCRHLVRLLLVDDLARRRQVGRHVDHGLDLARLEGRLGRGAVGVGEQRDRPVHAFGDRLTVGSSAAGAGWTTPILAASGPPNTRAGITNDPTTMAS